jgi:4-amino-4-deoxy-L-arabinose transferase-like glycosyltransferase
VYLLAPFQSWQAEPSSYAAQVVVVAVAVAGVAAAWWLGERAYGVVAGGVAAAATAVATVHVAYSRVDAPDVLLATLVTVALALLVSGRIELAGLVAGLAAAAKYPGVLVLVPILVVAWGRWRRAATAVGFALVAFAVASPYAVAHVGRAASALWDELSEVRAASVDDQVSVVAFADYLWEALGPALVVALAGLAVAVAVRDRADRALASFVVVYFAALLPLGAHHDRYVLPLIPVLGVLAGRFRAIAPVTLLLLVVPLTWAVRDTRELRVEQQPRAAVFQLRSGP